MSGFLATLRNMADEIDTQRKDGGIEHHLILDAVVEDLRRLANGGTSVLGGEWLMRRHATPAMNTPDFPRHTTRSWEQIPAGWFVHAPKSTDWYEVTITRAIHSGLQLVTLRALDGKVIETQRPRGQQVMCCPGKAADTSATDAVFGAFPSASIIEDQAD